MNILSYIEYTLVFLLALCWIYIQKMQRRANYLCYGPIISSYTIITLCFKTNKKRRNQSTSWIIFAKRKYLWQKIEYHESCSNTISHFLYIVFNNILHEHHIVLELNKTYIIASLDSLLISIIFSVVLDRFSTRPQSNLVRWNVRFLRRSIYAECNWWYEHMLRILPLDATIHVVGLTVTRT